MVAPGIIAVVKANAYGHGAAAWRPRSKRAGATMLAVADIEEGVDLRKAGVRAPILVFGALSVSDLDGVFDHELTPTISSPAAGHALQDAAAKRKTKLRYHLKIDTGHESAWVPPRQPAADAAAAARRARTSGSMPCTRTSAPPTSPVTRCSRPTHADSKRPAACSTIWAVARDCAHAANSAALLRDSRAWFDFVRPGLLLYGLVPPPLHTTHAARSR